tara:strand:+ start:888 stop:2009 length:1122 start_codon:yes stop_codon:yes gene_type:complete
MNRNSIVAKENTRSHPFNIKNYSTEWDHWCRHAVPFINAKFGKRPWIDPLGNIDPLGDWTFLDWEDRLIEDTIKEHPVVYLGYGSRHENIKQLYHACEKVGKPRLIITTSKIRSSIPVPDSVRIIHTEAMAYQYSKTFSESGIPPVYHRKVTEIKHNFLLMASNINSIRVPVVMMLKGLGVLEDALWSCPKVKAVDQLYYPDPIGINSVLSDLDKRVVGGEYIRFDFERNMEVLPQLLQQCHFHVAMESDVLYTDYHHWCVDEKHLQGYTTTTPVLPIWGDEQAEQMREWGFRFENIPGRAELESKQEAIMRWCREILFYCQLSKNPDWAQSWQDSQGETTSHNFELNRKLHEVIYRHIEKQIDELPPEFRDL